MKTGWIGRMVSFKVLSSNTSSSFWLLNSTVPQTSDEPCHTAHFPSISRPTHVDKSGLHSLWQNITPGSWVLSGLRTPFIWEELRGGWRKNRSTRKGSIIPGGWWSRYVHMWISAAYHYQHICTCCYTAEPSILYSWCLCKSHGYFFFFDE